MNIYKRLANVQSILKAPKNQYNSFGKYNYRSCEDIIEAAKPICIENGLLLLLSDEIVCKGGKNYVEATATVIDIETEKNIICTASARESETKKGMDDSQITGSTSSYARKYALNGLFAIDDTKDADTNEHSKQVQNNNNIADVDKITTQQLIDMAKSKGFDEAALIKKYNQEHNKNITEVKYIAKEVKQSYYKQLENIK